MSTDSLIQRVRCGTTTVRDAQALAALMDRMAVYEQALRQIAIYGSGETAIRAVAALTANDGMRKVPSTAA